jgi:hypothetical protein
MVYDMLFNTFITLLLLRDALVLQLPLLLTLAASSNTDDAASQSTDFLRRPKLDRKPRLPDLSPPALLPPALLMLLVL